MSIKKRKISVIIESQVEKTGLTSKRFDKFRTKHKDLMIHVLNWNGGCVTFKNSVLPSLNELGSESTDEDVLQCFWVLWGDGGTGEAYTQMCKEYLVSFSDGTQQDFDNKAFANLVCVLIRKIRDWYLWESLELQKSLKKNPHWKYGNKIQAISN